MGQKGKFLVTNEGSFDLGTYTWDDQLFSDIIIRENPIDTDQAMGISRSLREEISKLEISKINKASHIKDHRNFSLAHKGSACKTLTFVQIG